MRSEVSSRRGEPCDIGGTPHVIGHCDYYHEDVELLELRAKLERVQRLHDRLAESPNDRAHYFAGLLRRALEDQ